MKKITKRMVRYVFLINLAIIILAFLLTRVILPKIYINNEYNDLEKIGDYLVNAIEEDKHVELANASAVLLTDGRMQNICGAKGQVKNIDFSNIKGNEIYRGKNGHTFIIHKKDTVYGDLMVYKSYEGTEQLIKSVDIMMMAISMVLLICSILLAVFLGNRFTRPIIILQQRAKNIAKGIYDGDCDINTDDEFSDLAESIDEMAKGLELKDNMQREFIANVSHDLKTPLSIIRANSEVIKDGFVSGDEVIDFSENIINEADRLNQMVGEILELTRLRDNNRILKIKKYSLMKFINESYDRLVIQSNMKNNSEIQFELNISVKDFEKIMVKIDPLYLFRAISNLFNNAVIHSDSKKIIINVEEVKEGIKIGIKDYGKGINEDELKFIWDRYYKGNKSGGMGLGLAISKEIILAHGFRCGVESILKKETEFYFIIKKASVKII